MQANRSYVWGLMLIVPPIWQSHNNIGGYLYVLGTYPALLLQFVSGLDHLV